MKCNLELPCSSCVRAQRAHLCHENPPNPPSEEETRRREERRSRNSRLKEKAAKKEQTAKTAPGDPNRQSSVSVSVPSLDPGVPSDSGGPIRGFEPAMAAPKLELGITSQDSDISSIRSSSSVSNHFNSVYGNPLPFFGSIQRPPPWNQSDWQPNNDPPCQSPSSSFSSSTPPSNSPNYHTNSPFSPYVPPLVVHSPFSSASPSGNPEPCVHPTVMAQNVHRSPLMAQYAMDCKQRYILVPTETATRWKFTFASLALRSGQDKNAHWLSDYFNWAYSAENSGFQELVDWLSVFITAQRLVSNFDSIVTMGSAPKATVDKHSLQCMALACSFLANGALAGPRITKKVVSLANEWLSLSDEIGKNVTNEVWQDGIYFMVLCMSSRSTIVSTSQLERLTVKVRDYFTAISSNESFLRYLHQLEFENLSPQDSEAFSIVAKCWTYLKLVETEASVLQAESSFQYEHAELKDTIQPDRKVVKYLFNLVPEEPISSYQAYDIALLASSLFFRRFENCKTAKDIAYAYLSLYSEFCAMSIPASEPLFQAIEMVTGGPARANPGAAEIAALVRTSAQSLGVMLKVSFICVRWLSIIRAEPNKFVTLRFAHYVTTLLSMFNPLMAIVDTGKVSPHNLIASLQCCAQLNTVLDMYNMLTLQALFVAVMSNFVKTSTAHWGLDVSYLLNAVLSSYGRARKCLETMKPYSNYPLSIALLQVSEVLTREVHSTRFQPRSSDKPAHEFFEYLQRSIAKENWDVFVNSLFGMEATAANYIEQLWRFGDVAKLHQEKPILITKTLVLNTAFIKEFEHAYRGFWFTLQHVNQYLEL
ncbi:hypothetical protein RJF_0482 [Candidozyma auris]